MDGHNSWKYTEATDTAGSEETARYRVTTAEVGFRKMVATAVEVDIRTEILDKKGLRAGSKGVHPTLPTNMMGIGRSVVVSIAMM